MDDNKIVIKDLEFKKLKDELISNELLNSFYTTPQSDLIYKSNIIKSGKILIKYIIKIIINLLDQQKIKIDYFEPKMTEQCE